MQNICFSSISISILIIIASASALESSSKVSSGNWYHKLILKNIKTGSITIQLPDQIENEELIMVPTKFKIYKDEYTVWVTIGPNSFQGFYAVYVSLTSSIPAQPYFANIDRFESCILYSDDRSNYSGWLKSKCMIINSIYRYQVKDDQKQLIHEFPLVKVTTWDGFKNRLNNRLMVDFAVRYSNRRG